MVAALSLSVGCAPEAVSAAKPPLSPGALVKPEPLPQRYVDEEVVPAPSRSLVASRFETRVIGSPVAPAGDSPVFQPGRPGATIDLDIKDVDIANVCRLLADVGRVSIVLADDVHGTVTVRLKRVRWDRALDVILLTRGLRAERDADVIVVYAK